MITQSTIDLSWALLNADEVRFTQVNLALVFTASPKMVWVICTQPIIYSLQVHP